MLYNCSTFKFEIVPWKSICRLTVYRIGTTAGKFVAHALDRLAWIPRIMFRAAR